MDLTLSHQDQSALHQLLVATPEPGTCLLPRSAVDALTRLISCDLVGGTERDRHGHLIRSFEEPTRTLLRPPGFPGPLVTGLRHQRVRTVATVAPDTGWPAPAVDTLRLGEPPGREPSSSCGSVASAAASGPATSRCSPCSIRFSDGS